MKDAVLTRIFAGHERSPCRWSNWRKDRLKGSGHPRLHQLCQVRHATFGDPGTDECPGRCVQTYDYCLGAFLRFAVMVRVQSCLHSDQRLLIFMVSIKILQREQANHYRPLINFSAWEVSQKTRSAPCPPYLAEPVSRIIARSSAQCR